MGKRLAYETGEDVIALLRLLNFTIRLENNSFTYMSNKPRDSRSMDSWTVAKVYTRKTTVREVTPQGPGHTGVTAVELFKGTHDAAVRYLTIRIADEQERTDREVAD